MKIDHIGIAVRDLGESKAFYEALGLTCGGEEEVAGQKVRVAFFAAGDSRIELLEPTDPLGPIGRYLEKRGPGLHHLCVRVEDIEKSLEDLKAKGYALIDEEPKRGSRRESRGVRPSQVYRRSPPRALPGRMSRRARSRRAGVIEPMAKTQQSPLPGSPTPRLPGSPWRKACRRYGNLRRPLPPLPTGKALGNPPPAGRGWPLVARHRTGLLRCVGPGAGRPRGGPHGALHVLRAPPAGGKGRAGRAGWTGAQHGREVRDHHRPAPG